MTNSLNAEIAKLVGLECWYVAAGGATGSSFSLALGGRVPRIRALKNPAVTDEFRQFEGEVNLLVWCSWRLDGSKEAIVSSDCGAAIIETNLGFLQGTAVTSSELLSAAHDLQLGFGDLRLTVFCDRVPAEPGVDTNWELHLTGEIHAVGPGWKYAVEPRKRR